MAEFRLTHLRHFLIAAFGGKLATTRKTAARFWVHGGRHLAAAADESAMAPASSGLRT